MSFKNGSDLVYPLYVIPYLSYLNNLFEKYLLSSYYVPGIRRERETEPTQSLQS